MSESNDKVNPLDSMDSAIKQLVFFHEDLSILDNHTNGKYTKDFEELRDKTDMLRAEYSVIYSKILEENPKLKVYVGGI